MPAGIYVRKPLSEEHKKHISEGLKGNKNSSGRHNSLETKRKMSEAHMGEKSHNFEKLCPHKGIPRSEESRQKMSEIRKENPIKYWLGKHLYEETKKKLSKAHWKGGIKVSNKKHDAKRREFDFIPLNPYKEGYVFHHLDKVYGIYMDADVHKSIWHSVTKDINMDAINALAFNYL